jgi:ubiquinone biosynthesis protein COQ9
MSETPKKPRARKAAAQSEAKSDPKPKTEAASEAPKPDDAALKEAVLLAALPQAAFDGFTAAVLEKAGVEAGLTPARTAQLFENGPVDLLAFYSEWADAQMEQTLAGLNLPAMKVRERIAAAVKARLAVLRPNKEAARRAAALLSLPPNAALAAKLLYRTVDAMWRAAGDTSTDFNFYTKRGILAGVYGATALRWFTDTSDGEKDTDAFLAARIENVMQFETLKTKAKQALSGIPAFADWVKPKR